MILNLKNKQLFLCFCVFIFSCKVDNVDGIIIGNTLLTHQTINENRRLSNLIEDSLNKNKKAVVELINFPNGGAASGYDLGYVITQIIYRLGEKQFIDLLIDIPKHQLIGIEGYLSVGLEYGDNDYDGNIDYKTLRKEFPKLNTFLKERL